MGAKQLTDMAARNAKAKDKPYKLAVTHPRKIGAG